MSAGTELREQIIGAITQLHDETGEWPSPVLVAERLGRPARTLRYHIHILTTQNALQRLHGGRALRVVTP